VQNDLQAESDLGDPEHNRKHLQRSRMTGMLEADWTKGRQMALGRHAATMALYEWRS